MNLTTAISLSSNADILQCSQALTLGDEVVVDGLQGRGFVTKVSGKRLTVRFRNGLMVSRDMRYVHSVSSNMYKSDYSSQ